MSVFKVKLTNVNQGLLDSNGQSSGTSIQRGVYVMGPNKVNRLLIDGTTFTDSNYWKRFAYPQVAYEYAIVSVVTDDGSVYVDNPPNSRVFPLVSTFSPTTAYDTTNVIDYLSTYGSYATYVQIAITTGAVTVRINGAVELTIAASVTQIWNPGDLDVSKLEFKTAASGTVVVFASIRSVQNS